MRQNRSPRQADVVEPAVWPGDECAVRRNDRPVEDHRRKTRTRVELVRVDLGHRMCIAGQLFRTDRGTALPLLLPASNSSAFPRPNVAPLITSASNARQARSSLIRLLASENGPNDRCDA